MKSTEIRPGDFEIKTMTPDRREFLSRITVSGLALQSFANKASASRSNIRAVAFDGFPILDPRPVFALVDQLYPEHGVELSNVWRGRQFEYTWLRTLSRRYSDFWQVTDDALVFAAKAVKVEITPEKHASLMEAYLKLQCWPDVPAALSTLKKAVVRLAFLSNLTARMLDAGIRNSRLEGVFDHVLSTDLVKAFKRPVRRGYSGLRRDFRCHRVPWRISVCTNTSQKLGREAIVVGGEA